MPLIPPIQLSNLQIKLIKKLMSELNYTTINKLIIRSLSILNVLEKLSWGAEKRIYLLEGDISSIKYSHNNKYILVDTDKVKLKYISLRPDKK